MTIRTYCRIPPKPSSGNRFKEGSCPQLLQDLFSELENAKEIHIAAYLFNNPVYFDFLKKSAESGCKIKITSLPVTGYVDGKVKVEGYRKKVSPRVMSRYIYHKINTTKNMFLYIFPHLYAWYGARYAGGGATYSFHVKAIFAKYGQGKTKCILSSGNFMLGDPPHSDNFIVLENMVEYEKVFGKFFEDLEKYSIPYKDYRKSFRSYKDEFYYSFVGKEIHNEIDQYKNCFFTAPFYFYGDLGSNHFAANRIRELIHGATKRIWVCAQHFHDLASFDTSAATIISAIYDKYLDFPKLEFRFLKQVPHSSLADKRRAAIAETLFQYVMNAQQRYNRLTHDKFMIIDNTLLVSTANFTSTQFAFGKVKIEYKDKDKNKKYQKVHNFSEINGFIIIPNCPKDIFGAYIDHFNRLWESGKTISIRF